MRSPLSRSPAIDGVRVSEIRDVALSDGRRLGVRAWPGRGLALVLLHGPLARFIEHHASRPGRPSRPSPGPRARGVRTAA